MAFDLVGKAVKTLRLPTVDYSNSPIKIIPAQAGDVNSRYFYVELYDERGDIELTPYSKVLFNTVLPDDRKISNEGEITTREDNGKPVILIKISASMLELTGRVSCDVSISGTDANNEKVILTSQTFYIISTPSQAAGGEALEGDDDYISLVTLLDDIEKLEEELKAAEANRVEVEADRVEAEEARVIAENAREQSLAATTAECEQATADAIAECEKATEDAIAENKQATSDAISECEKATLEAIAATENLQETLDALPFEIQMVDSASTQNIVTLQFVELEG